MRDLFVAITLLVLVGFFLLGHNPVIQPAFAQPLQNVTAFSQDWALLTESDTVNLSRQPRALFICSAGGGTLVVAPWANPEASPTTFTVNGGTIYPISPGRLYVSSTVTCVAALY